MISVFARKYKCGNIITDKYYFVFIPKLEIIIFYLKGLKFFDLKFLNICSEI